MHEVKINNIVIQIPSCWDELSRKQLGLVASLTAVDCNILQIKIHLLFYIAGIRLCNKNPFLNHDKSEILHQVKLKDSSTTYLSTAQINELCNMFDFLFFIKKNEEKVESIHIDSRLTMNLIPKFRVSGRTFYGPASRLFNITLSEFIHAETNLNRYAKTKDVQHLDRLIAILYRPQKNPARRLSNNYDGDIRIAFNDHKFEQRAIKFGKLNHTVKLSIYFFYCGCQWWYQQQFPHVFKKGGKKAENNLGFLNLVDALTGGDVTKTKEIYETSLMDVMVHMERAAEEFEKMEERLKKK